MTISVWYHVAHFTAMLMTALYPWIFNGADLLVAWIPKVLSQHLSSHMYIQPYLYVMIPFYRVKVEILDKFFFFAKNYKFGLVLLVEFASVYYSNYDPLKHKTNN